MVEAMDNVREKELFEQLKAGYGTLEGHWGAKWRLKTSPQILRENSLESPDEPALRKKRYGIWNSYTWKEYYENMKYFSLGLISLGFTAGDKMAIIGDNDPEWWFCQLGAQAVGGVGFGVFIDCIPSEIEYFCGSSDATFAAAKDQEQCDKFLEIKDKIPNVKKVVYWEPKGMWRYEDPWLMNFWDVIEMGREYERKHPKLFEEMVDKGSVDDTCCLAYTSGTTGLPKAAVITYRSLIAWNVTLWRYYPCDEGSDYYSFLCPAWAVDQILGFVGCLQQKMVVHFPESPETVVTDAREISSVTELAGARMWEERYRDLLTRIDDADFLKRFSYKVAMSIGRRYIEIKRTKAPSIWWKLLHALADALALHQLRDRLGYVRSRVCLVAGAMMSPELFTFFQAIGIPLYTYYGITEAGFIAMQLPEAAKPGSVGKVLPGRTVEISDEGEVLIGADDAMMFSGYYKNEGATKETVYDGWYHTGDAGYIDDEGYFFFMDRISEMMALNDGTKFSGTYIESELRCSRYIADAMVVGHERDFVSVLIQIDLKNVGNWAENNRIAYNTFVDLSQKEGVYELILGEIRKTNTRIPKHSRIASFVNLHKEFDADEAEMTRTRKLKRAPLEAKYQEIIDAVYTDKESIEVHTEVKYRDGRVGAVRANVRVMKVNA
ncbi:MAG: AMP-binding protein [Deltaproteobacteria bacterium]|nr:AMP-binding protein [Deltaproteobacteria bacterium]